MMLRHKLPLLLPTLMWLLVTPSNAQINLIPNRGFEVIEDVKQPRLEFQDGDTMIFYSPPETWRLFSGGANKVTFSDTAIETGEVVITARNKDSVGAVELQQAAVLADLPPDAEILNPPGDPVRFITIAKSVAWEYQADYKLHGRTYRQSVIFLTFDHAQLRFTATAPETGHAKLRGKLTGSLCTWAWDDEKHLTPVTLKLNKKEETEPAE